VVKGDMVQEEGGVEAAGGRCSILSQSSVLVETSVSRTITICILNIEIIAYGMEQAVIHIGSTVII